MNPNYWNDCYHAMQACNCADCDGWLNTYQKQMQPGSSVLDLGCGAGANLEMLLGWKLRISAADFSPDAIELIQENFGKQLISADCFDMRSPFPYPSESFDAVISDLSLHYFTWTDTVRIVSEIGRILRPGGMLLARVHALRNLPEGALEIEPGYYQAYGYTRRYFTLDEVQNLFADWKLNSAKETIALRYGGQKHVIEFSAEKLSEVKP